MFVLGGSADESTEGLERHGVQKADALKIDNLKLEFADT